MYRQGDVVLTPVAKIKGTKKDNKILAEGEMTGHKHQIKDGEVFEYEGTLFVKASEETTLVHEEHGVIKIDKGNYQVTQQREYDEIQHRYVND